MASVSVERTETVYSIELTESEAGNLMSILARVNSAQGRTLLGGLYTALEDCGVTSTLDLYTGGLSGVAGERISLMSLR